MAETAEAPSVELKPQEKAHMQEIAQRVVLGEQRRGTPLVGIDRRRVDTARRNIELGKWNQSNTELQGNGQDLAFNLRGLVDKFGVTRNNNTGEKDRTQAEQRRHSRAETALTALTPLLESANFDQMTRPQQDALRADVLGRLQRNPRLLPAFATMSAGEQRDLVNRFLQDQNLKQELVTVLRNVQGLSFVKESDILGRERELADTTQRRKEHTTLARHAEEAAKGTKKRLTNIQNGNIPQTPQMTAAEQQYSAAEIARNTARGEATTAQTEYNTLQGQLDTYVVPTTNLGVPVPDQKAQLLARRVQASYTRWETARVAAAQSEKDLQQALRERAQAQLIAAQQSTDREDSLEEKAEGQSEKASEARIAAKTAPVDERAKRIEMEELREERHIQEETVASRLEGALGVALENFVINELNHSYQTLEGQEGTVRNEATKTIRDELRRHLETRWSHQEMRSRGLFRRRNEIVRNRAQINQDFTALLQNGPEPMMRTILNRLRPTDANGVRTAIDPTEVTRLMRDDEFKNSFQADLVKGIVANRSLIRRLRPGELKQMMDMEHVRSTMEAAFNSNEEYRNNVQEQMGAGNMDLDDSSFRSRFARAAWRQPGLLLFPLTSIPWAIIAGTQAAYQSRTRGERRSLEDQL